MTNAERIRQMSDEELAELINSGEMAAICPLCNAYMEEGCIHCDDYDEVTEVVEDRELCIKGILGWVQQESEVGMPDRKYIAISIKHSEGHRFTLWGWKRTKDNEKRCFSGYVGAHDYDKCELYSLEDFREKYGHGVIKCDEAVPMTGRLVTRWKEFDTVLVDYERYKRFVTT